jgi:hypothetical protein
MNKPDLLSLTDFSVNVLDPKRNNNLFYTTKYNLQFDQYAYKQQDSKKNLLPDTMQFVKPNSMSKMSFSNMNVLSCQNDDNIIYSNNLNKNGNNLNNNNEINNNNNNNNNNNEINNNNNNTISNEEKNPPFYLDLLKSIGTPPFHKYINIESFSQQELSQKIINLVCTLIIVYVIYTM